MIDMCPGNVIGDYREVLLNHYDGVSRKVYVTEIETPMPDGRLIVSRTNPQGVITHVNKSFVEMCGYAEDELIGAPHYILRHPDMPAAAFKTVWDTLQAQKKWHGYVKNLRKDGGYYWVYATVIPNIRNGQLMGYTSVRRKPSRAKVKEAEDLYKTQWSN